MPFPSGVPTGTITINLHLADGTIPPDWIDITPHVDLVRGAGVAIPQEPVTIKPDPATGVGSVTVAANVGPLGPPLWRYEARFRGGAYVAPFLVDVTDGGTTDLSTVSRDELVPSTYTPVRTVAGVAVDASGDVPAATLATALGGSPGGGGGGVTSVAAADATVVVGGSATAPTVRVGAVAQSQVTGLPAALAGKADAAALAAKVDTSRQILAGTGLTGGGTLAADRTLAVAYGTTSTTAARGDDPRLSDARPPISSTTAAITAAQSTADAALPRAEVGLTASPSRALLYDRFARPDGAPGTAESGAVWGTTGPTPLVVDDGALTLPASTGTGYAYTRVAAVPRVFGGRFTLTGTDSGSGSMTLICCDQAGVFDGTAGMGVHLVLTRAGAVLQYRVGAGAFVDVPGGTWLYSSPLTIGRTYTVQVALDPVSGTVGVYLPGGYTGHLTYPQAATLTGRTVVWEVDAPSTLAGRWDAVWAVDADDTPVLPYASVDDLTTALSRVTDGLGNVVAQQGTPWEATLGRTPANLPGVMLGDTVLAYLNGAVPWLPAAAILLGPGADRTVASSTDVDGRIPKSLATTKGDLIVATGAGTFARLPAGADGQVPTTDASQPTGYRMATPSSGGAAGPNPAARFGALALTFPPHDINPADPQMLRMAAGRLYAYWLALPTGTTVSAVRVPIGEAITAAGALHFAVYQNDGALLGSSGDVAAAFSSGGNAWHTVPLGAPAATTGPGVWVTALSTVDGASSAQLVFCDVTSPDVPTWLFDGKALRFEGLSTPPSTFSTAGGVAYYDVLIGVT